MALSLRMLASRARMAITASQPVSTRMYHDNVSLHYALLRYSLVPFSDAMWFVARLDRLHIRTFLLHLIAKRRPVSITVK
jgi:hypothetical protein